MENNSCHKEVTGFWHNPDSQNSKHFGVLRISNSNEIVLTLFSDYSGVDIKHELNADLRFLHGLTDQNEEITLFGYSGHEGNGGEVFKRKIKYDYCLFGRHIGKNEIDFSNISFYFTNQLGFFKNEYATLTSNYTERQSHERILFTSSKFRLLLQTHNSTRIATDEISYTVTNNANFKIEHFDNTKIYESIEIIKYLQLLFSVLTQQPTYCYKILIPIKKKFGSTSIDKNERLYINKESYFNSKEEKRVKIFHEIGDLDQQLEDVLKLWFEYFESLISISELLLGNYFTSKMNETINFLNRITAIESWHRIFTQENDIESVEFYESLIKMTDNPQLKNWIKDKKQPLTGLSLRKRLKSLIEKDNFHLILNESEFVNKTVNTRNSIAHNLPNSKKKANPVELYLISLILKSLLEIKILKMLQLDNKNLEKIIKNGDTYKRIKNFRELNPTIDI